MNRLNAATFQDNSSGTFAQTSLFNEDNITYDLNGNIKTLYRTGDNDAIDVLTYDYGEGTNKHSNKLLSVTDAADITKGFKDGNTSGDDYTYDPSGNMTVDNNKDITGIQYNHLNLPYIVTKNTGEYIKYTYDATGRKLRQEVFDASNVLKKTTDYDGEFFYENDTKFVNHEEGRVVMAHADGGTEPEYQYNLKDQLGNVRLTFTSKEETDEATATMETSNATAEQSQFLNYNEVRKINSPLFDHTNEGTTFNSVRLMGGNTTEVYGLAKSLSVMPGDVLNLEVYAKYLDPDPNNWSSALMNAIAAIAGTANPSGTFVDGGATGNTDGPFPYPNVLVRENDNGTGPKAYLNYIIFDRNFNYIDGGFKRVTTNAREYGQGTDQTEGIPHERLFLDNILIKEPGYVYIYLSNENETPVEVFFDDFEVEHIKSPVVQMDDYYPFGLTYNSYQRENSLKPWFKFQGQEHIDDLDLGWDSFKWRNHQPEIGRFFSVDPLAEKYYYNSPYAFSENKVVAHVELEGLESSSTNPDDESEKKEQEEQSQTQSRTYDDLSLLQKIEYGWIWAIAELGEASNQAQHKNTESVEENVVEGGNVLAFGLVLLQGHMEMTTSAANGADYNSSFSSTDDVPTPFIQEASQLIKFFPNTESDLTVMEAKQIQSVVDQAGRPLEVVGSAAKGTRRGVGTNLPIGKGPGTKSDIDYLVPPSSMAYYEGLSNKLPSLDPKSGIIPGTHNPGIGPGIRFEPGESPSILPFVKY